MKPEAPQAYRQVMRIDCACSWPHLIQHTIEDMDIPGFRLHALRGEMKGRWSIAVNGNWRVTFEFKDGNCHVLDYEDYH